MRRRTLSLGDTVAAMAAGAALAACVATTPPTEAVVRSGLCTTDDPDCGAPGSNPSAIAARSADRGWVQYPTVMQDAADDGDTFWCSVDPDGRTGVCTLVVGDFEMTCVTAEGSGGALYTSCDVSEMQ